MDITSVIALGPVAPASPAAPASASNPAGASERGDAADTGDAQAASFAALLAGATGDADDASPLASPGLRVHGGRTPVDGVEGAFDGQDPGLRGLEVDSERLLARTARSGPDASRITDRATRPEDLTLSPEMSELLGALEIAPRLAAADTDATTDTPEADIDLEAEDTLAARRAGFSTEPDAAAATSAADRLAGLAMPNPGAATAMRTLEAAARGRTATGSTPSVDEISAKAARPPRAGRADALDRAAAGATVASGPGQAAAALRTGKAASTAELARIGAERTSSADAAPGGATGTATLAGDPLKPTGLPSATPSAAAPGSAGDLMRSGVLGASAATASASASSTGTGAAGLPPGAVFQAQLSAALESPAFAPALGVQLRTLIGEGIARAELQLHPADLGPISVSIQMDGMQAQVQLTAGNPLTRDTLQQAMPQLGEALREAGLSLGGGTVSQQPSSSDPSGGQGPSRGHGARGIDGGAGEHTLDGTDPRVATQAPRGLLDLYA